MTPDQVERAKKDRRQDGLQEAFDDEFDPVLHLPLDFRTHRDAVQFIRDAVITQSARALDMAREAGLPKASSS